MAFASELKAIAAFPEFVPEINPHAVAEFLGRGWLPEDHCIWQASSNSRPAAFCLSVPAISRPYGMPRLCGKGQIPGGR